MFSADWLMLREPADFAARSAALTQEVAAALEPHDPVRALDLASGTGANVRYIADRVKNAQHWLMVDHDPVLLADMQPRMAAWAAARAAEIIAEPGVLRFMRDEEMAGSFTTCRIDLRALDDPTIFSGRALVTASALLDLVSEPWLRALARRCRDCGAAALFALTYDGRIGCSPEEPEDRIVCALVNRHQRTDKGFGPAVGPDAVTACDDCFRAVGYRVRRERSDWVLSSAMSELQRRLIEGWAHAAAAMAPSDATSIERWRMRRLDHVRDGRSQLVVGHEDLAAWPLG